MTVPAGAPVPVPAPGDDAPVWHTLPTDQVLHAEKVDGPQGLSSAVALSIVVVAEIRKAVRRRTASGQKETR